MSGKRKFSTTRILAGGFLLAIAAGTALLSLPFASAGGVRAPLPDILFTAVSAVCVTGLVTVPTYAQWSLFGQLVILILIELGGLGVTSLLIISGGIGFPVLEAFRAFLRKEPGYLGPE